jgi:glycosyltransferase involved in cell wall biosynthesis
MTRLELPPGEPTQESGLPGAPRKDRAAAVKKHFVISFAKLARRLGVLTSLLNADNFQKAVSYLQKGNFSLVLKAFRNLWVRDMLRTKPPAVMEEFHCPPLQSGQPLVSVVIPCFNYGQFVVETVDSVLNQTLSDVEVIVVDGGSTDSATLDVLRDLVRPRTRVLFRTGRHLVGANRNFGIEHASGRYICCLDADDTIAPTYLEKAVFMLETYGYDIISTAIRFTGHRSGTVGVLHFPNLLSMTRGNHVNTCAVFRRVLWERSGGGYFDVGLGHEHVAEDWDFWVRLAATGARIRNIADEALFNYRIHLKGSLSSAADVKPISVQGESIMKRNCALLTPDAFRISKVQQEQRLRAPLSESNLVRSMTKTALEAPRLTLMLAMPYMLIGGAERLLSQMTGYLVRRGWRVIVVTTVHQDAGHGDSVDWFEKYTPEVYALPRFLETDEWQDFVEYLVTSRRPDCLLTAGSERFYEWLPVLSERHPDMAMVDLLFNTSAHTASHLRRKSFYTLALAESEEVMRWFQDAGWQDNKVRKLTSGIDLDLYRPSEKPADLIGRLGIAPSDLVIGFSGRLSPEKAPEVFLEIAKLCQGVPNLRFVMTGGGPMREDINTLVQKLPSNVRFDCVGIVDDVKLYLALYDVLVLPSRLDGRPVIVLEALASGLPVIASRVGGLPEMIEDDYNGYLCSPGVASEFAAHIRSLAADRQLLQKLKLGARAYAEQHLNSEEKLAYYEASLRDAINFRRMQLAESTESASPG